MKKRLLSVVLLLFSCAMIDAQEVQSEYKITLKSPGNPAESYTLTEDVSGYLKASQLLPIEIKQQKEEKEYEEKIMAQKREFTIKKLSRKQKLNLIQGFLQKDFKV